MSQSTGFWSLPQHYGDEISGITATLTQTEQGRQKPLTYAGQPRSIRLETGTQRDLHSRSYHLVVCSSPTNSTLTYWCSDKKTIATLCYMSAVIHPHTRTYPIVKTQFQEQFWGSRTLWHAGDHLMILLLPEPLPSDVLWKTVHSLGIWADAGRQSARTRAQSSHVQQQYQELREVLSEMDFKKPVSQAYRVHNRVLWLSSSLKSEKCSWLPVQ